MSDDDHPVSSIELRSLRRRSTIESGRHHEVRSNELKRRGVLRKVFRSRTEVRQDAIQEMFAKSIIEIENAQSFHQATDLQQLRRLSKEYGKFKERPAAMCHRFFSYWNFAPMAKGAITTNEQFCDLLEGKESVSAWMCRVASMLEADACEGSQLIVVTEEPGSEDLPSFFSFSHFTQATFRGNLKTIHSEPAWVLLFVVAVTWGIYLQPWATDPDAQEAHELARPMPLMRPSLRSAYVTPGPSNHIHWGSKSQNNGNLDANRGDNEILLSWLRSVTSFKRDLNVYIWEPHTKFPSTEHAKILICPPRDHKGVMRIVISLRSCRLHAAYIKSRDAYLAEQSVPTPGGQDPQPWSNALLSILCVLEVLVSDTDEFLRAYHNESARMRVVSRQNPTISKLRFMMHLEDSRKIASDGTKHAMNVLDNLAVWAEQNTQTRTETRAALLHVDKMAAIREDLEFCDREIERLGSYTETDQQTLRQHFQLSQDLTLFRLTLLAAIFLPLSFTTSLFGMNMKNADEGFGTFSEFKNDTLGNITGNITDNSLRNITEALVSIISTSGNLNYDWAVFAGTAIGLTFILPLTLAVGAIMRTTVVSVVRYIKYWRALTLLIAGIILLAVMAISILGGFLGRVFWAQFYNSVGYGPGNIDRWISSWYGFGTNYQYAPPGWGSRLRWADYLLYPYWAINGLLLLMLIFLLYQSWSEGKERFFWTTQLLVTASCFTIDFMLMAYPLFPFMVIPWVWLGFFNAWVRPRGWKLFARWWTALFARWR